MATKLRSSCADVGRGHGVGYQSRICSKFFVTHAKHCSALVGACGTDGNCDEVVSSHVAKKQIIKKCESSNKSPRPQFTGINKRYILQTKHRDIGIHSMIK